MLIFFIEFTNSVAMTKLMFLAFILVNSFWLKWYNIYKLRNQILDLFLPF